jgi:tetratricopeptide (TPR) repeat protein
LASYQHAEIEKALESERKQPESPTAHFKLAETYVRVGAHDEVFLDSAIQEYNRVIQLDPRFFRAYIGLAEAYKWLSFRRDGNHNREAAVEAIKQAIRINPNLAEAHVGLCEAYSLQSRYEEAVAACQLAIRIDPTFVAAFIQLGNVYSFALRYDDAVKAYQVASKLEPNSAMIYRDIGETYEDAKGYDQAIINYQHSIRLSDPEDPYDSYLHLMDCYTVSRRFPEGIAYFRHRISVLGEARICRALLKEKPMVCIEFQDDGQTKSTVAHHALGVLYARSGDKKSALEQYKILKLQGSGYPESRTARLAEILFNEIYK